eukprot:2430349-Ditylum_brightwellii.AAC.1
MTPLEDDRKVVAMEVPVADSYSFKQLDDPSLMGHKDIWVNGILPFLGPGCFVYVALVCKKYKENYLAFFSRLEEEKIPRVFGQFSEEGTQKMSATNTTFG